DFGTLHLSTLKSPLDLLSIYKSIPLSQQCATITEAKWRLSSNAEIFAVNLLWKSPPKHQNDIIQEAKAATQMVANCGIRSTSGNNILLRVRRDRSNDSACRRAERCRLCYMAALTTRTVSDVRTVLLGPGLLSFKADEWDSPGSILQQEHMDRQHLARCPALLRAEQHERYWEAPSLKSVIKIYASIIKFERKQTKVAGNKMDISNDAKTIRKRRKA
ncbi:hypothetical protein C0J52_27279, partial [Blattella germanica]